MSNRTYTVYRGISRVKKVYEGFDKQFRDAQYIGLVAIEGNVETWALDQPIHARNLVDYYEDDGYTGVHVKIFEDHGFTSNPKVSDAMAHPATSWKGV